MAGGEEIVAKQASMQACACIFARPSSRSSTSNHSHVRSSSPANAEQSADGLTMEVAELELKLVELTTGLLS